MMFIDSNDRDRFPLAIEELEKMLAEDELRDAFVVIMCNKQDLPNVRWAVVAPPPVLSAPF